MPTMMLTASQNQGPGRRVVSVLFLVCKAGVGGGWWGWLLGRNVFVAFFWSTASALFVRSLCYALSFGKTDHYYPPPPTKLAESSSFRSSCENALIDTCSLLALA